MTRKEARRMMLVLPISKLLKNRIQLTLIVGFLEGEKVGGDTGRGVGLAVMGFDVCGGSVQPPLPPFTQTQ